MVKDKPDRILEFEPGISRIVAFQTKPVLNWDPVIPTAQVHKMPSIPGIRPCKFSAVQERTPHHAHVSKIQFMIHSFCYKARKTHKQTYNGYTHCWTTQTSV